MIQIKQYLVISMIQHKKNSIKYVSYNLKCVFNFSQIPSLKPNKINCTLRNMKFELNTLSDKIGKDKIGHSNLFERQMVRKNTENTFQLELN